MLWGNRFNPHLREYSTGDDHELIHSNHWRERNPHAERMMNALYEEFHKAKYNHMIGHSRGKFDMQSFSPPHTEMIFGGWHTNGDAAFLGVSWDQTHYLIHLIHGGHVDDAMRNVPAPSAEHVMHYLYEHFHDNSGM